MASMPAVEATEPQLPPFDHTPAPYDGPSKEKVHALRKQYLSPGEARLTDGISGQAVHCLPALSYIWCLLELNSLAMPKRGLAVAQSMHLDKHLCTLHSRPAFGNLC